MAKGRYDVPPIFVWAMASARSTVGGAQLFYEVRLNEDLTLSCSCPGWINSKGQPGVWSNATKKICKCCKHTKSWEVQHQVPEIMQARREGRALPTVLVGNDGVFTTGPVAPKDSIAPGASTAYGRIVDLS